MKVTKYITFTYSNNNWDFYTWNNVANVPSSVKVYRIEIPVPEELIPSIKNGVTITPVEESPAAPGAENK